LKISNLFTNALTLVKDPTILSLYFSWWSSKLGVRPPYFIIRGAKIGGFPNFSSYLGAVRNALTDEELEFVIPHLDDAKIFIDVGANFGAFVIPLAKLAQNTRFFAFEPNPMTAGALRANIRLNGVANVTAIEAAISDADGEVTFSDTNDPATNRILEADDHGLTVVARSLDSFCHEYALERIDFLKIDVEGAELDVLHGAANQFSNGAIRSGIIEICPGNLRRFNRSTTEIVEFFNNQGFDLFLLEKSSETEITDQLTLNNAGFRKVDADAA
jgi:FkbM family methyltransferase